MKIFKAGTEIAIEEEDLKEALNEWLKTRFKYFDGKFSISDIRHCRSDSTYALRFHVCQVLK